MTFQQRYAALEDKFKAQIEEDNKELKIPSFYLPNVEPKDEVDFVLVAMEPSGVANESGQPSIPRNFVASYREFCGVL